MKSLFYNPHRGLEHPILSATYLLAGTLQATTATNGLKCSVQMLMLHLKKQQHPMGHPILKQAANIAKLFWKQAEAEQRWNRSKPLEAESRNWMHS